MFWSHSWPQTASPNHLRENVQGVEGMDRSELPWITKLNFHFCCCENEKTFSRIMYYLPYTVPIYFILSCLMQTLSEMTHEFVWVWALLNLIQYVFYIKRIYFTHNKSVNTQTGWIEFLCWRQAIFEWMTTFSTMLDCFSSFLILTILDTPPSHSWLHHWAHFWLKASLSYQGLNC